MFCRISYSSVHDDVHSTFSSPKKFRSILCDDFCNKCEQMWCIQWEHVSHSTNAYIVASFRFTVFHTKSQQTLPFISSHSFGFGFRREKNVERMLLSDATLECHARMPTAHLNVAVYVELREFHNIQISYGRGVVTATHKPCMFHQRESMGNKKKYRNHIVRTHRRSSVCVCVCTSPEGEKMVYGVEKYRARRINILVAGSKWKSFRTHKSCRVWTIK